MSVFDKIFRDENRPSKKKKERVVCPDSIQRKLDNCSPEQVRMMIRAYKGELPDDKRY